jgi:hypothetical protein
MGTHSKPNSFIPMGLYPSGDFGPWTIYTSHRRKVVSFLRSPPKTPANYPQRRQRHLWIEASRLWSASSPTAKANWRLLASRCHLKISAYNLFIFCRSTPDRGHLETLCRQARITLASLTA